MGKIVAIGGGELRLGETKAIDQYIVGLCGKESPKLMFLPTASTMPQVMWKQWRRSLAPWGALSRRCALPAKHIPRRK